MMDPDKDLPFGDLDRINLDDEPRQRTPKDTAAQPSAPAPQTPRQTSAPAQQQAAAPRQTSASTTVPRRREAAPATSKWLPALVVLLLLLLVGVGGWGYTQITALQARLDQQQNQASSQLDTLQSQISATGSSVSATSNKLGDSLADHGKELTRLAANDLATRRRVSSLEDATDKLQASIKQLHALSAKLDALQQQMKLADISASQLQMQQDLNVAAVKKFTATAASHSKQLKALATAPDELAALKKQLHTAQEAIHAFDKWRQQVGAQLNGAAQP